MYGEASIKFVQKFDVLRPLATLCPEIDELEQRLCELPVGHGPTLLRVPRPIVLSSLSSFVLIKNPRRQCSHNPNAEQNVLCARYAATLADAYKCSKKIGQAFLDFIVFPKGFPLLQIRCIIQLVVSIQFVGFVAICDPVGTTRWLNDRLVPYLQ
jgi:hypothetical protein